MTQSEIDAQRFQWSPGDFEIEEPDIERFGWDPESIEFSPDEAQESILEGFNSSQPRGDDGKWIDGGAISLAKGNPKEAAKLFARTTDPEQRAKLEKLIGPAPKSAAKKSTFTGAKVGAEVHAHAEGAKHRIAKAVGGIPEEETSDAGQKDKKPYDVKVKLRGPDADIEVKTMTVGAKTSISVHEDALLRKVDHQRATGNSFHTVVEDARDTYGGGANKENYSGHPLYYKRGSGRYALANMYKVKDEAELKRLIALPDDKLPDAARGSLPPPPPLSTLREMAARASESRKARDTKRKARNRGVLNQQARARGAKQKAGI